jgi:hypothetical protein
MTRLRSGLRGLRGCCRVEVAKQLGIVGENVAVRCGCAAGACRRGEVRAASGQLILAHNYSWRNLVADQWLRPKIVTEYYSTRPRKCLHVRQCNKQRCSSCAGQYSVALSPLNFCHHSFFLLKPLATYFAIQSIPSIHPIFVFLQLIV